MKMISTYRLFLMGFFLFPLFAFTQSTAFLESPEDDQIQSLVTLDNGALMAGQKVKLGVEMLFLYRLDEFGQPIWAKEIQGPSPIKAIPTTIALTDSAIYMTGSDDLVDGIVLKFDLDGNFIWGRKLTCPSSAPISCRGLLPLNNNLIAVSHTSGCGAGSSDAGISMIDENGNLVRSKHMSGTFNDHFPSLKLTSTGDIVGLGNSELLSNGYRSGLLSKVNQKLEIQSQILMDFGGELSFFGGTSLENGNLYAIAKLSGLTSGDDLIITLVDSNLNHIWSKQIDLGGDESSGTLYFTQEDSSLHILGSSQESMGKELPFYLKMSLDGAIEEAVSLPYDLEVSVEKFGHILSFQNNQLIMGYSELKPSSGDRGIRIISTPIQALLNCEKLLYSETSITPNISNPSLVIDSNVSLLPYSPQVFDLPLERVDSVCLCEPELEITISDHSICPGKTTWIQAGPQSLDSVVWSDGTTGWAQSHNLPGKFWVNFYSHCGPQRMDYTIHSGDCECEITLPNIFTPNGDAEGDLFSYKSNCPPENFEISIFNRWGKRVFTTHEPENFWNGKIGSSDASEGVYYYTLRHSNGIGEINQKSGFFHLIR